MHLSQSLLVAHTQHSLPVNVSEVTMHDGQVTLKWYPYHPDRSWLYEMKMSEQTFNEQIYLEGDVWRIKMLDVQ
jgi:hypothetical protein